MKASEQVKRYTNAGGATVSTVKRDVLDIDGLTFKDIDGSGTLSAVNDWRVSPEERAKAYAKVLSVTEKIALLFTSDWRMGPKYPNRRLRDHVYEPDESGLLDEAEVHAKTIFGEQHLPGTHDLLCRDFARHIIVRDNPKPSDMADWLNQMQYVCEECAHFVPVEVMSNSRNENGEAVFGMNDAAGVFATWPGTLGIAAAVKGTGDPGIIERFASCIRREWKASGLRKGYMYMADCVTDPRWQRTFGTFGEDPELISSIFEKLVPGIQGSEDGVTRDGVAMTVKHFPGGGARENGFDPHYAAGQWNVYATEGSLQKYHMRTFLPAVKYHASAIMPYYSKPSADKSAPQQDAQGNAVTLTPQGFAYNKTFIDGILRGQLGFDGYINSDTGIVHNMSWGVEMLDVPERIGYAVSTSGVDLISGQFDMQAGREALERATNGWYDSHPVPEGFTREEITLSEESIDRAVIRTMTEMFRLGLMDDPYADPQEADAVSENADDRAEAAKIHRESVVLLKKTCPLSIPDGTKVYAEAFAKRPEAAQAQTEQLRRLLSAYTLVDTPAEAAFAILLLSPSSGAYFSATPGYLELDICENKTVFDVGADGRPCETTHAETTLMGIERVKTIAETLHTHGGKVFMNLNVPLAWMPGNVEPYADVFTVGFDTLPEAVLDIFTGKFAPVGKLPLTLPRNDAVLQVNADGVCVSPNDVPGFAKDAYMPDGLKDENGKAYAYRDSCGNYYEYGFGLKA